MQLSGTHTIQAPIEAIWDMLLDPIILARITPAVSRLELLEENKFKAIADVKIGPVQGSFSGNMEVAEKNPHESFILKIKQNSKIGNVAADIKISLDSLSANETKVSFNGKALLSGLLARTGQRVVGAVANSLSKQFFVSLQKEVEEQKKEGTEGQTNKETNEQKEEGTKDKRAKDEQA